MKAFLDTSVLVATFYRHHRHHQRARTCSFAQQKTTGSTAAHCIAECFAVVTGFPGKDRASPQEPLMFLDDITARLALSTRGGGLSRGH